MAMTSEGEARKNELTIEGFGWGVRGAREWWTEVEEEAAAQQHRAGGVRQAPPRFVQQRAAARPA